MDFQENSDALRECVIPPVIDDWKSAARHKKKNSPGLTPELAESVCLTSMSQFCIGRDITRRFLECRFSSFTGKSGTMSELLSGISNLTKQISNNIPYQIKKLGESVHTMVMNYTEAENLVYEATNEDPWGPTGPQMKEIANYTFQYEGFHQVMNLLWKRMLEDNKTAWRRVYKSLTLLNHLLFHGSERVIGNARDHTFQMRVLEHYKYVDDRGRDQGLNVADFASIRKGGARGQTPRSELNLSGLNFCFTSCHAPILQRWL
ncbi:hypothetical protein Y032_0101g3329 [Ancylostoma ceylanicum]|uniref:ENTH domain-containing protein n=1 Tax=Ancylostoma ceylanicum TaxID=53326 RepID=A0A016THE9_9BILA|nr:hypothetical protein Y032_0101g3329 [Ancylostoma ceylanicum]